MAKKEVSRFTDWSKVDEALGVIRKNTILIKRAEALMNDKITDIKRAYEDKVSPLTAENKDLEKQLELFTKAHIREFTDKKTREFTYGRVGFRKVSEIVTRNIKAIIGACRQHGMDDCIRISEKLDKEALEKYNDAALVAVGAHRKEAEKYFYDIREVQNTLNKQLIKNQ